MLIIELKHQIDSWGANVVLQGVQQDWPKVFSGYVRLLGVGQAIDLGIMRREKPGALNVSIKRWNFHLQMTFYFDFIDYNKASSPL